MNAAALLAALEVVGVRLSLAGDSLHYHTRPGVSISVYQERITANKPALLTVLALQDRIVATATAPPDQFNRDEYDRLWREWYATERKP